jgi:uncharacterized protein (DUF58 family)
VLTRSGWLTAGLAAALVLAGRLLGSLELTVLGAVAAGAVVSAAVYTAVAKLHVSVDREVHPQRVHAGTPARVDLVVANGGGRRSPVVRLFDAVEGTRGAELGLGPLAPGGTARASYRLPTARRGVIRVGPLVVTLGDPFGFTAMSIPAAGATELIVYPRVDPVAPVPLASGSDPLAGAEHPSSLGRVGEDFYALRQYVVGDDLRRVHWPSTARHDELMVRQDELPWQGRTTILAEVRRSATSDESLETVVSVAASLVVASARRDDLVRLATTDGADTGLGSGRHHADAALEHLAGVEASPDALTPALLDRLTRTEGGGALVAVLTARTPDVDLERLARLRTRLGSLWIVMVGDGDGARRGVPGATTLIVDSTDAFAGTWSAAVRRPATTPPVAAPRAATRR